jgi:hypothetical protein
MYLLMKNVVDAKPPADRLKNPLIACFLRLLPNTIAGGSSFRSVGVADACPELMRPCAVGAEITMRRAVGLMKTLPPLHGLVYERHQGVVVTISIQ